MKRPTLILLTKEPRPGRVKTRLGRDIGMVPAAWWFRHQSARLLRRLRDPRWRIVLAVAPDVAGMASRVWPGDLARIPQGTGDLGVRMRRAMGRVGNGPVCLIGGDIPGVTPAHIARAFGALDRADVVFGPAEDGGYWLVGVRNGGAIPNRMFDGTHWSGPDALSESVASVAGARVAFVDVLWDVDCGLDLAARPLR